MMLVFVFSGLIGHDPWKADEAYIFGVVHHMLATSDWVVAGMILTWALLTTLWMPWLDFAKSYRTVFTAMPIPDSTDCIASVSLGEGERAMLRNSRA